MHPCTGTEVKVKGTLVQVLRLCTGRTAHRGSRGIALPFHDHSTRKGVRAQRHAPAAFYPPGKTRYPVQEHGWDPGVIWTGAENLASTGIRSPDRPPRSQSLYRLSYPALCSGNACYHSVKNPLSSSLLSKNLKIKIYRTIILHVVLYGCDTWSLTLKEERRLRVFENRVLRRIFGPKRDEVTWEWRKLHKEELNDLYCSPNIVRVIKSEE